MAKPKTEPDPFAIELGKRIDEAWRRAKLKNRSAMIRKMSVASPNQVHVWCRGEAVPSVQHLMEIARVTGVSIDWLLSGTAELPRALMAWRETPAGRAATDEEVNFLRMLPLRGWEPTVTFYDIVHRAWTAGLVKRYSGDEIVAMGQQTDKLSS